MDIIITRLEATANLLRPIEAQPALHLQISKLQSDALLSELRRIPKLSCEEKASLVNLVLTAGFSHSDTLRISAALTTAAAVSDRREMQDYSTLSEYFTESEWTCLQAEDVSRSSKMWTMFSRAHDLGCRCPSEGTKKLWSICLISLSGRSGDDPSAKNAVSGEIAASWKKFARAADKTPHAVHLLTLPKNPGDFQNSYPSEFLAVYGASSPVATKLTNVQVSAAAFQYTCRRPKGSASSALALCPPPAAEGTTQLAVMAKNMMDCMMNMQREQSSFMQMCMGGMGKRPRDDVDIQMTPVSPTPSSRCRPVRSPEDAALPPLQDKEENAEEDEKENVEEPEKGDDAANGTQLLHRMIAEREHQKTMNKTATKVAAEKTAPAEGKQPKLKRICKSAGGAASSKSHKAGGAASSKSHKAGAGASSKSHKARDPSSQSGKTGGPHFNLERTRLQVMCRTGKGGPGSSFAIKYGVGQAMKTEQQALTRAKAWVSERG
jgi:hypothetical protein